MSQLPVALLRLGARLAMRVGLAWLALPDISDKQVPVVCPEDLAQGLVMLDECLADGQASRLCLADDAPAFGADRDIKTFSDIASEQDGFHDLQARHGRLHLVDGEGIDADTAFALDDARVSMGVLALS